LFQVFGLVFGQRSGQLGRPGPSRSFFLTIGFFLLALGVLATTLAVLLRYQSQWYTLAAPPQEKERLKHSQEFMSEFTGLRNDITGEREWWASFTDVQINSYLEEDFIQSGLSNLVLPEGITKPRVVFDADRIHLAFRYGSGIFSTLISIDLRVWLAPREQNVVVLELEGFRAGALPISAKTLLEKVSEVGRSNGISVNWYRDKDNGHPVAVLCFQEDERRSTMLLQAVKVKAGEITITGRSSDSLPAHPPPPTAPVLGVKSM